MHSNLHQNKVIDVAENTIMPGMFVIFPIELMSPADFSRVMRSLYLAKIETTLDLKGNHS